MATILSDHTCERQALAIFAQLSRLGYGLLIVIELRMFRDVGLTSTANDEAVWQFCQEREFLLLTGNRTTKDGQVSLELTIRRLVTESSLPVLTVGDLDRILSEPDYRERCAERLATIILDLETYRGVMRLYLPT